jgi:hypothetical protein
VVGGGGSGRTGADYGDTEGLWGGWIWGGRIVKGGLRREGRGEEEKEKDMGDVGDEREKVHSESDW